MPRRRTPWLDQPFTFKTFFDYETGIVRRASGKKGGKKPPRKPEETVTTMAVGEEGDAPPPNNPPGGKTTPAIGEEGVGSVPTTTIAKGEEGS